MTTWSSGEASARASESQLCSASNDFRLRAGRVRPSQHHYEEERTNETHLVMS